jgi:hypothetical protein
MLVSLMNPSHQDNPKNQGSPSKILNKRYKTTKANKPSTFNRRKLKDVAEEDLQKIKYKNAQENLRKQRN